MVAPKVCKNCSQRLRLLLPSLVNYGVVTLVGDLALSCWEIIHQKQSFMMAVLESVPSEKSQCHISKLTDYIERLFL